MPSYVPRKAWKRYKSILNDFMSHDAARQPVLWLRKPEQLTAFGEDAGIIWEPHIILSLFQYNYIRTWPFNDLGTAGEIDTSNIMMYISKEFLSINGYIDQHGYWDFNWAQDRFIVNGKVYKPGGDTQVAQASEDALMFLLVMSRTNSEESKEILDGYVGDKIVVATGLGSLLMDSNAKYVKDSMNNYIQVWESCCKEQDKTLYTLDNVEVGKLKID